MTPDRLADDLVPIAAELVGTVRDFGPDDVAKVLARVPDGRHDALAVVLAAMVDPDARPQQLLAWTQLGPVPSRSWASPIYQPSAALVACEVEGCGALLYRSHMPKHARTHRETT